MATPDAPPACAACAEPLVLLIQPSDDEDDDDNDDDDAAMTGSSDTGTYVDDDVHLQCGCHFHWQCLLDTYTLSSCPSCSRPLITTTATASSTTTPPQQQILCTLHNEGGVQRDLDILPLLTEEAYLSTFPEERLAHAFLALCAEGDVDDIVDLLRSSSSSDVSPQHPRSDILRYQHPAHGASGLHIAVSHQRPDVAWLMLLLASTLEMAAFPGEVVRAAEAMGLQREEQARDGRVDVRALRDGEGMTAGERAGEVGGVWEEWVAREWLSPPEG